VSSAGHSRRPSSRDTDASGDGARSVSRAGYSPVELGDSVPLRDFEIFRPRWMIGQLLLRSPIEVESVAGVIMCIATMKIA
jgi:hypothetical protein